MSQSQDSGPKEVNTANFQLDFPYNPTEDQLGFFKKLTGISDDEELKKHIYDVQQEAWKVAQYMCIRNFGFMKLNIGKQKKYAELLTLGKENPQAIYLEFACCFGNDARMAISDGFPLQNVVAADIEKVFWDLGHKLFKTTPETYPVPFVHGSVFDPLIIAPRDPFYEPPSTLRPDIPSLTSLTPLQGHVSAIHVTAFFHIFDKDEQIAAARALASLLSPAPGSFIFGGHGTQLEGGPKSYKLRGKDVYCFSPEEWVALWDGEVFKKGTVSVEYQTPGHEKIFGNMDAERIKKERGASTGWDEKYTLMIWSVTRV